MKLNFTFSFLLLFCFFCNAAFSQTTIVKGVVKQGNSGDPLPGASIKIPGTSIGAITDNDGKFTIKVNSLNDVLRVSYISFISKDVTLNGKTEITIALEPDNSNLDEVVVIGYGTQKKETLVGAINTISTKELVQSPVANISNSLAGRLPGLTAVQRSGEPGQDASSLKIRGIGTLSSGAASDPLIMIDGVPREIGNGGQGALNNLDPNEIESITVLKDASATAVFGVRGANGVILVTTKSGKLGKPSVSFSTNIAVQNPTSIAKFLNAGDYAFLKNEGSRNDNQPELFSDAVIQKFRDQSDPIAYPNSEWLSKFIKSAAPQQQYNLNISGGVNNVKYFVSAGYFNQEGIYDTDGIDFGFKANPSTKRYNFRSNFDINLTKMLTATLRLGTQNISNNYPGQSSQSVFFNILNVYPFTSPGLVDGKLVNAYVNDPLGSLGWPSRGYSPYSDIASSGFTENTNNNLNMNLELKHQLDFVTKGLSIRGLVAFDNTFSRSVSRGRAIDTYTVNPDFKGGGDYFKNSDLGNFSFSQGYGKFRRNYYETSLNYARSFGGHNVTALALYQQETRWDPTFQFSVPRNNLGMVGRITYDYKAKYLFDFSMGYNGSENFPETKRYGFFPAFGVGWVVTEEKFIPKNNILSRLKLRGSYGEVGNDKIGGDRFLYLPSVFSFGGGSTRGYSFGTTGIDRNLYGGSQEDKLGNPNVTWERAVKSNIGIDLSMFKSRLTITADYFREDRNNILVNLGTVPALVAANLPAANIGKVKNRGFELEMNWRTTKGDFTYSIGGNMAFSRNKILFADEPTPLYPWMASTGFSVGQLKTFRNAGFYNNYNETLNRPYNTFYGNLIQPGDLKYVDIDGDGKIDQNDQVPSGYSTFPEITFGMPLSFSYKNFDLSVLLQGSTNIATYYDGVFGVAFGNIFTATIARHLNRWTPERFANGELINEPRLSGNGTSSPNIQRSDFFMHNGSYIRLKNVEIGFRIPKSVYQKIGVNSIRVYVNGSNLATKSFTDFKDMDPEKSNGAAFGYPQMRVINGGVSVQF
ncbi:TonB-dependent receptor [Pedobacter changchengzhani]|uniref:TonB-dependent receptor n=1 Tax=Pedobacter changchengzhani TaxID=2529274 RepID=A0A4R5MID9_9SPHI|nr:TonB-dependent receptor [Pedobacter changchengzhani]TDG35357.1 TonB-dependent receptor [Pedobacter changchengzhani]